MTSVWRFCAGFLPAADVVDYLRDVKPILTKNCTACHGEDGKGNRALGAPDLTDAIWLYGADKATIVEGVWNGRAGMMPAWVGRLDETTIKALAVFVHTLGGGEK